MQKRLLRHLILLFISVLITTIIFSALCLRWVLYIPESDNTWWLEILGSMALFYSVIFVSISVCTFATIFLNLKSSIRNNYLYSLLTFMLIPSIMLVSFLVNEMIDHTELSFVDLRFPLALTLPYWICAALSFFLFRRKLKKLDCDTNI